MLTSALSLLSCRPLSCGDCVSLFVGVGDDVLLYVCLPWLDMLDTYAARVRQSPVSSVRQRKENCVPWSKSDSNVWGARVPGSSSSCRHRSRRPGCQAGRKYWEAGKAPALFTETRFCRGNDPSRLPIIGRRACAVRPVGFLAPFSRAKNELQDPATLPPPSRSAKTGFDGAGLGSQARHLQYCTGYIL